MMEMFYLMTHSTYFIYNYNDISLIPEIISLYFSNALNTLLMIILESMKEMFYLTTHSTHTYLQLNAVKDNRDTEKGNMLPLLQELFFLICSKKSFFKKHHDTQDSTYHCLCYGALTGIRNNSMCRPGGINLMTREP